MRSVYLLIGFVLVSGASVAGLKRTGPAAGGAFPRVLKKPPHGVEEALPRDVSPDSRVIGFP